MILKIDTTNRELISVELKDPKTKKIKKLVEKQKTGSQVLIPMIHKILKNNKLKFSNIESIEVNPGPGSFTGTRIGVTVANILGYTLKIPVNGKKGNIVLPKYEKSKFD